MADETTSPAPDSLEQMAEEVVTSGDEEGKSGLMTRMNPMRLFRKNSASFQLRDAQALLEKKLFAQATIAFQKTLELEPGNVEGFKGLGMVLMMKGGRMNLEASLKQFEQGIRIDPLHEEFFALNAQVLQALGRGKEATLEKKKALSLRTIRREPNNAIACNNVGIAMVRLGKTELAIEYFRRAIESDKNYDVPRRNLASTYYQISEKEGNPQKQKEWLSRALAETIKALEIGESAPTLVVQARIFAKSGESERALEVINKANDLQPGSKLILTIKQSVLENMNRLTEARETYEGAKNLAPA